jgi:polar amino acid transport system substrate-binding protein
MFMDETVIFVKKGREFNFRKLKDLKQYKGVAIINDSFGTEFDNFDSKELKILRLKTTEQCFNFLEASRADYIVAGIHSGMDVANKLKLKNKITILPKRVIITGMYAPISLKSKWSQPEVEKFLSAKFLEYQKNGTLKKLEEKYSHKI